MELADTVFADCESILEGYENAVNQLEQQKLLKEQEDEIQDG